MCQFCPQLPSGGTWFFGGAEQLPEAESETERPAKALVHLRDYTPPAGRKYLYTDDLERITGIPASTWKKWRSLKKGPPYRKFGGRVAYDPQDMEAWDAKQKVLTE